MLFHVVVAAQGEAAMIPRAAIPGIGKHDVLILVVADPLAATFRFDQVDSFAA
jgi:hypothetical protein